MIDPSQILVRLLALLVATGTFAGLWANDRLPDSAEIIALNDLSASGADFQPGRQLTTAPVIQDEQWRPAIPETNRRRPVPIAPPAAKVTYTRAVDAEQLTIPTDMLQRHIHLLPVTLPSGDYRIIDSYGGVGWLIVRAVEGEEMEPVEEGVWTTSIDGVTVRFIRTAPQPDRVVESRIQTPAKTKRDSTSGRTHYVCETRSHV